ncbi:S-type pyocin domain-containing protein [Serratia sp. UGAL515B_01]|uniref:S-type pyocin domain-containing protein n=1 Tax=Serratia sp. UGAL515B_01 TaxID=2986763 RepID=UPI00295313B6|nr:S-type pyocin domain-containing protein [Serratia sp. UGAL515B_01]WON78059.1 S-type pyocin domain-containing protein [Serratia sp. UGAL515B_01]
MSVLPFSVTPVHLQGRYNVEYIPGQGPQYTYYSQLTQLQKMFDEQIATARTHIIEPVTQVIGRAIASLQGIVNTQAGNDSRVSNAGNLLDAAIKGLQDANNDLQVSENLVTQKHDAAEKALKEAIPKLGLTNVSPVDYDLLLTRVMDPISRKYWEELSVKPRVEEFNAKQRLLASLDNIVVIINDVVSKSNTLTAIINQVKFEREASAAAEVIAKAEAEARAKLAALMLVAGVNPTPIYTSAMVESAQAALTSAGRMILNRASGMLQLSTAANGVLTTASDLAGSISGALWRGAIELSRIATVSTVGSTVAALVVGFYPKKAGEGSDQVPGRDIEMFAAQAQLFAAGKVNIQPEMTSVDLPVRGLLVTVNGRQYVSLIKTGVNGVSENVPVLRAVRDEQTGLDKITLPAVGGVPARTILVNPVPTGPAAPSHTGNSSPAPVTPVHTGTEIKQVASIVTTTYPADDLKDIRDFIYWQPDATGSGVEPIYVMLSEPLDSGRFTRKQLDKKFKHAIDFGINDTKKNRETLTKYRDAIEAHLADTGTVERGTYRREKGSKVYFNPKTMNVVILKADEQFLSGWKINPDADNGRIYLETGDL